MLMLSGLTTDILDGIAPFSCNATKTTAARVAQARFTYTIDRENGTLTSKSLGR